MSQPRFTPEQLDAIEARGGTILVSAAAGSGKTAVLVERVTRLLTDPEQPIDADHLVVVTFTKAAAAEMRERIDARINDLLRDEPDNVTLHRQKLLLRRAHIDTIHAFCSSCLREFFARAGIAPDFRIADDSEMRAIRAEALSELIDEAYSEGSSEFHYLVELLGDERSDRTLSKVITELADYVTAYPDPEARLREFARMYESDLPVAQTGWGRWTLQQAEYLMDYAIALNDRALDEITLYPEIEGRCRDIYDLDGKVFENLRAKAAEGDWDGLYSAVRAKGLFKSMPRSSKSDGTKFSDDPDYVRIDSGRSVRKKLVSEKIPELLCADSAGFADDRSRLAPAVKTLCGLVSEYRASMARRKSERKLLDYDDLEHLTAALLFCEKDGVLYRTDTARELAARFDELLIDEYQDTNYTQDLIFRAISREPGDEIGQGGNLFLVGDIKQSIYSFRKAVPQLFLRRLNEYRLYNRENPCFPAKIILDRNFRSRPEVTEAVNFIFEQIMTERRGGIVYDAEQRLTAGRTFPEAEGMETELHLFSAKFSGKADEASENEEESAQADDARAVVEARYCARLIQKMVGSTLVTDGDGLRPAEYGDFCILRRGVRAGAGQAFIDQFSALGIPVSVNVDEGFFRQPEVCVVLSLLRAVDNPLLDVPLTAALRSPIFGFDSKQLALLRSGTNPGSERGSMYACLRRKALEDDMLCVQAVELLDSLRTTAAAVPCDRLLRTIYTRTGYLAAVQAMPNGRERRNNLLLLLEYARTSESTGNYGLSGFLRMMTRMEEDGRVQAPAPSGGSCVTVRTMHNAKGLQFPICIISGLAGNKNNSIKSASLPIHERLGVGAGIYDADRRLRYPSVQRQAVRQARYADEVDEELRVLYVALTRAVDKLIMLCATDRRTSTGSMLNAIASSLTEKGVEPMWMELSASMGKWITACALRHPDCDDLRARANALYDPIECQWPLRVKIVEEDDRMLAPVDAVELPAPPSEVPDEAVVAQLRSSMDYVYPYSSLVDIPAKVTASQTHKHGGDFSGGGQDAKIHISPAKPSFMTAQGLTPTERGTALHRFMQFCDLDRARENAAQEIERLVQARFITRREGDAVDTDRVAKLFAGPLGKMLEEADKLYREWRFTVELPSERLSMFTQAGKPEEMIVLQGECDLLLISGGEAIVVDYKTDQVTSTDQLVERYRDQLTLYTDAVAAVTGLPVRCCIYSFRLSELREL